MRLLVSRGAGCERKVSYVRNAVRRRAMGAFLAAVIAFGAASCVPPQKAQSSGTNTGFSFSGDLLGWSNDQILHDFRDVKAMGGTWVRVPFNWITLEPNQRGNFDWATSDRGPDPRERVGLEGVRSGVVHAGVGATGRHRQLDPADERRRLRELRRRRGLPLRAVTGSTRGRSGTSRTSTTCGRRSRTS